MKSRTQYENELADFLKKRGYTCMRSAGSRGPVDVFAFNNHHVRFIQVKSTYDFGRKGNATLFKAAIKLLQTFPCPPNATRELWVRVLRGGWRDIVIDDAPEDDAGIRGYLSNVEWVAPPPVMDV